MRPGVHVIAHPTDLDAEVNRSRRGSEPISGKETRPGGAAGQTGHNRRPGINHLGSGASRRYREARERLPSRSPV